MTRTSSLELVSTRQEKIAKLAREAPGMVLTTLAHHIDLEWLKEAYRRTPKDRAPGVDGVTAAAYEAELEANLTELLKRLKTGSYRAPAVRRVHLPKPGKGQQTRPIGIPTLEDKVLQRAVLMVLEPVYEQDFLSCSYGFRPGRSAHQAIEALRAQLTELGGGWVIDLDIQSFFDTVDWAHLRSFLDQRVRDGVIRRAIGKWLNAGVMEQGVLKYPEEGTPQGGVISPLLSNVYLHEVLDQWFEQVVKPRLKGRGFLIRYADDAVLGFECEEDARRVMEALPQRFARFGLKLHPEKTRMIDFRSPDRREPPDEGGPRGFTLLGFTHFWARSGKERWTIQRKTAPARFARALRAIWEWCRANRHRPVAEQHAALSRKLRGHYAYYGITGNYRALACFLWRVGRTWRYWLSRRSHRARMPWDRFNRLLARSPLPPARVVHSAC